jgi:DNA-binding transcriptional regulator LsrR (DeoR family)
VGRIDDLRLMVRVARLYHEAGARQPEIAERLHLSQATISRLLRRAEREGIVRITVSVPAGAYPELEEALQARYGLQEAIVVDCAEDDEVQIMRDLGGAAAYYVESTIRPGDVLGVASYASLLPMVNVMRPLTGAPSATGPSEATNGAATNGAAPIRVVQLSGGVGNPAAEAHATQLIRRLAGLVRGEAVFLPAPGLAPSAEARLLFLQDPFVQAALRAVDDVTLALVGIGATATRSPTGFMSAFALDEEALLAARGAVGFICHRFFDAHGAPVETPLDQRIIAVTRAQLGQIPRTLGISGGRRRQDAIQGALEGHWVTALITDQFTAARLLDSRPK